MKKFHFVGLLLAFCVMTGAFAANATEGYPCNVSFNSSDSSFGDFGFMRVEYYTSSHCGGTYLAAYYYCSTGATISYCASSGSVQSHNTESMVGFFQAMAAQARDGDKVDFLTSACIGGGNCGGLVYFR